MAQPVCSKRVKKSTRAARNERTCSAFGLSRCNVLSCNVLLIRTPRAEERAAVDDLPHSIDYHDPVGLSSNSRAGAVNQPVAEPFAARRIRAEYATIQLAG